MSSTLKHLAIVMDGNGRWASRNGYPRSVGHRQGLETTLRLIEAVAGRGISYLSLFALSCENLSRPEDELRSLEGLIGIGAKRFRDLVERQSIKLQVIGDRSVLSAATNDSIDDLVSANPKQARLHLLVAINYSGKWDILQALSRLRQKYPQAREYTAAEFESCLSTVGVPDPDLLIRTSGERRLSNFMLWQMAYTELYFHDKLWPEFEISDLEQAIASFERRERRFGLVQAQKMTG